MSHPTHPPVHHTKGALANGLVQLQLLLAACPPTDHVGAPPVQLLLQCSLQRLAARWERVVAHRLLLLLLLLLG
jgi:hypothetical protein